MENNIFLVLICLSFLLQRVHSSNLQLHISENVEIFEKNDNISDNNSDLPPIFVLNLDRSPQRWLTVSQELAQANVSATRLSAIDGRLLSEQELAENATFLAKHLQPRGVLGCYLSHRRFWQTVVDQKLPRAIVLEDDIRIVHGKNFKNKLRSLLQEVDFVDNVTFAHTNLRNNNDNGNRKEVDEGLKNMTDVLMLGAIGVVHPQGHLPFLHRLFLFYMGEKHKFRRISPLLYEPVRAAGTHAYVVSYFGAQKLLNLCPKASFHIDLDAWRHHDALKLRVADPMLIHQTFDESCLTELTDTPPPPSTSNANSDSAGDNVTNNNTSNHSYSMDSNDNTTSNISRPLTTGLVSRSLPTPKLDSQNNINNDDKNKKINNNSVFSQKRSILAVKRKQLTLYLQSVRRRFRKHWQEEWLHDPVTQQPVSHMLDEPMLQLHALSALLQRLFPITTFTTTSTTNNNHNHRIKSKDDINGQTIAANIYTLLDAHTDNSREGDDGDDGNSSSIHTHSDIIIQNYNSNNNTKVVTINNNNFTVNNYNNHHNNKMTVTNKKNRFSVILTVRRHLTVLTSLSVGSLFFYFLQQPLLAKLCLSASVGFSLGVRVLIYLLMNYRH